MHTFIITLLVVHAQSTMLESGDDYYADSTKANKNQADNAVTEDALGLKIYNTLVRKQPGTNCVSLKNWLSAYAADDNKWETHDAKNPEFKYDEEHPNNITFAVDDLNQALPFFKAGIKVILGNPNVECNELWHLILCPVAGLRFLSAFEFALKANSSWSDTSGILQNAATKAYNKAKCNGDENTQCDKNVAQGKLSVLFRDKKGRAGDYSPKVERRVPAAKDLQEYNGGISGSSTLKGFWNKTEQQVFKLPKGGCKQVIDAFCTDTVKSPNEEVAHRNEEDCAALTGACTLAEKNKQHGAPPPMHAPAMTDVDGMFDVKGKQTKIVIKAYTVVVKRFEDCGVPWVGGVSGSALEQFAYAHHKKVAIDDLFVLQWMSLYLLGGFHSMGEVWAALKPMLEEFPGMKNREGMMKVPVPFTLAGACKANDEAVFLKALDKVVNAAAAAVNT